MTPPAGPPPPATIRESAAIAAVNREPMADLKPRAPTAEAIRPTK